MDNTSPQEVSEAPITDQETLEKALADSEPIEAEEEKAEEVEAAKTEEEPKMYLGKYKSPEDLAEAYRSLQGEFTKRNEELKTLREDKKKAELEGLKTLGYDEQVAYLVAELQRIKEDQEVQAQKYSEVSQEAVLAQDQKALEAFIASKPELVETGMDEIFRELATSPAYAEYTFESIYNARLKPKLEKLMGTKIRVRERPLKGTTKAPEKTLEDVSNLSKGDYEKNRLQILREAGIKI